ncbi:hypothetical protein IQ276_021025 [Desmonostoc muscorum LEGE 12446]|uniref:Uncharacterized protein n=1 Tax=Desmonostoc muscorum LEGE 12446 TaxID=1828758 RepID=A0A8J6ZKY4_DESMC|nr:hypothetical protein [Desmonostoc muscorum]MCF2148863.1 hypothetical protein [Desmonostoc muscorum LEGE 12446]
MMPYNEFSQLWRNAGFTEYVKHLEQQADEILQTTSVAIGHQSETAFLKVSQLDKDTA